MTDVLPLNLLSAGQSGQICDVSGETGLVRRLGEMGLRPGVEVRMVQPGRPCIVAVDHQRYSLRAEDEAMVLVEVGC
ncbi:MAG: FeoA family protein [Planctomycetota bacterium]|nr:FeoA family protein [Planctomycetota bacterium]